MLQDEDLKFFISAFNEAKVQDQTQANIRDLLSTDDGLFASEVWRLMRSLHIAAALGDAPIAAAFVLRIILDETRDIRFASFSERSIWANAIGWALKQEALDKSHSLNSSQGREREAVVGEACRRLRERGFRIDVGAYGPKMSDTTRGEIARSADALVRLIGGLETANQIFRYLRDADCHHDGIWLFGESGLGLYDLKRPMIPVGWLLSLALRNLNISSSARRPEIAWKSLVQIATDFAAVQDCQRYSQYEGIDIHPSQIHEAVSSSIVWRELFSLPQMPSIALRQVFRVLTNNLTVDDDRLFGFPSGMLLKQIIKLMDWSASDRLTIYPSDQIEGLLPLLFKATGGPSAAVNLNYNDPLNANQRTQDKILLFAYGGSQVVTLPRSLFAIAACEFVFDLIWSKIEKERAKDIVGKTLEQAIAAACAGKASAVVPDLTYHVGKKRYQLDVGTRSDDRITLIEAKGKALTRRARSGDMFSFFEDYSESFLRMLSQLVRHERYLREGRTPLTSANEITDDLRPIKVAVSPLSYGPVSDKMLSSGLIRALVGTKLTVIKPNGVHQEIIDAFNRRAENVISSIVSVAPKRDGSTDLFPYLIDVFWLDMGQLLYILDRANSVWDAFRPIKHITYGSRDFWTEVANADRGGMTSGKWRPVIGPDG